MSAQAGSGKRPFLQSLLRWYVARRVKREFQDVFAAGFAPLIEKLQAGPALLASNHVAWWDPLLMVHLDAWLGSDGYGLMDAKNLKKYPFFSWAGAVPLDRSGPARAHEDLTNAARLLDRPGRLLLVFAQGEQRPAHLPLTYKSGIFSLARSTDLPVYPMAVRYDFHESPRPLVHLSLGAPCFARSRSKQQFLAEVEQATRAQLDRIDGHLLSGDEGFVSLLGRSTNLRAHEVPVGTSALRALSASHKSPIALPEKSE